MSQQQKQKMGQEQSAVNTPQARFGDKQKLVTNSFFATDSIELITSSRGTPFVTGGSAAMMLMGNIGGNNAIDASTFKLNCFQLLEIIKPSTGGVLEGFSAIVKNLEEIIKLYDLITTSYSKQTTQLQFVMSGNNNNNLLLGSSTKTSSSAKRPAFDMMTDAITSHVLRTKDLMEELVEMSEHHARRSLKRNSVTSMNSASSMYNIQAAGYDWSNLDNKQVSFNGVNEF